MEDLVREIVRLWQMPAIRRQHKDRFHEFAYMFGEDEDYRNDLINWYPDPLPESLRGIELSVIELTPEKAEKMLGVNIKNRPLSDNHVKNLKIMLSEGNQVITNDMIVVDGEGMLANGQHRCMAVRETGKSMWVIMATGFPKDGRLGMDQGKRRLLGGELAVEGVKNYDMHAGALKWLYNYILANGEMTPAFGHKPLAIPAGLALSEEHPEMDASVAYASKVKKKFSPPSQVAFLHYVTTQADPEHARIFWYELADEKKRTHPQTQMLGEWLARQYGKTKKFKAQLPMVVINAWNNYCMGRDTNPQRLPSSRPLLVFGGRALLKRCAINHE